MLFKGELSLTDILYNYPYKRLIELRDARMQRLIREQKELTQKEDLRQSAEIRKTILKP